MKKKDYVPPKAIVISLQFEGHILAGTNDSPQIGFSSDESLGVTSEKTFSAVNRSLSMEERRAYGTESFALFNF